MKTVRKKQKCLPLTEDGMIHPYEVYRRWSLNQINEKLEIVEMLLMPTMGNQGFEKRRMDLAFSLILSARIILNRKRGL